MRKLYNTFTDLASNFRNFFNNICTLSKPQNKFISDCIVGMIKAESVVTTDIIKKLPRDYFDETLFSSKEKKFYRFFNNTRFNPYSFYDSIIKYVISNYKIKNDNVYISFDHMYCKDRFTIFLLSLKIGKQGIPLWFRCFEGVDDANAFKLDLMKEGIFYVHNLFKEKNAKLVFLADRWFNFKEIMGYIDSLNDTYCIRTKSNVAIHIDNYEDSDMIETIADIEPTFSKSRYFDSVQITSSKFQTKLAVSKLDSHKEPFFILTNGNTREAIKHYGYRFGSIEFVFKNHKSNGFYLESTQTRNIQAFTSLFTLMNVALLWLTIIGAEYSKSKGKISKYFKIRYSKRVSTNSENKKTSNYRRFLSIFNTGLILFNLAYESPHYYNLKVNFILYDI